MEWMNRKKVHLVGKLAGKILLARYSVMGDWSKVRF